MPAPFQGMTGGDEPPKVRRGRERSGGRREMKRVGIEEIRTPARPGRLEEIPERRDYNRREGRDIQMERRGVGGLLDRIQGGAKKAAGVVGPQVAAFRGDTGKKDESFMAKAGRHMRTASANVGGGMGGGMGMDFGFTPFAGGLPSMPNLGGMGPAPARAPRKSGGSKGTVIHVHVGGGGKATAKKPRRRKGGGGGVPPWDPNFRLPY